MAENYKEIGVKTTPQTNINFEAETALVSHLVALLEQEQTILSDFQLDAIEHVLNEKTQLINALSQASYARYQSLRACGYEDNETGMQTWLVQQATGEQLVAWKQFQTALVRSQELNRVNGLLINKFFNSNQQLLNVLQQGSAAGMYGPNGQTASRPLMRGGIKA